MSARAIFAAAIVVAMGCSTPATEVVVLVHAEGELQTRIVSLDFSVDGATLSERQDGTPGRWPVALRLQASEPKSVLFEVRAATADGPQLMTRARFAFAYEERRQVRVWLVPGCLGVSCDPDEHCIPCEGDACDCGDAVPTLASDPYDAGLVTHAVFDPGPDGGIDAGYDAGPEHCSNGRTDADETDTDCGGGSCPACDPDGFCRTDADCRSLCGTSGTNAGRCLAPECDNGRPDNTETGIDCGGACNQCPPGEGCGTDGDCLSRVCQDERCRPDTCDNGMRDGDESDEDCGGSCGGCQVGASCTQASDCALAVCRGVGVCRDACFAGFGVDCATASTSYLKNVADQGDRFGSSVALHEDVLVVGAPGEASSATGIDGDPDSNGRVNAGAVYAYRRVDGLWELEAYIKAPTVTAGDRFGFSVDFDGTTLVVGAMGVDEERGGAFVFSRSAAGRWSQEGLLEFAVDGPLAPAARVGMDVSVHGDWIAIGAPGWATIIVDRTFGTYDHTNDDAGTVYLFHRQGSSWESAGTLRPPLEPEQYRFGVALSLSDRYLAVGAPLDSNTVPEGPENRSSPFSGAVYVYGRDGMSWTQEAYLKAGNRWPEDHFGQVVALSGESLLVASRNQDGVAPGGRENEIDSGAGYLFERNGEGVWEQVLYLKAANAERNDGLGASAALGDGLLVLGAPGEDSQGTLFDADPADNEAEGAGAVYVFGRVESGWRQLLYLKAPVVDAGDRFGFALAISEGRVAIGADGEASGDPGDPGDNSAPNAGALWIYDFAAGGPEVCDGVDNDGDGTTDETFDECAGGCVEGLCE